MKEQAALQRILMTKYEELRLKNPQFSRRAFSKRLGLSAGAMSEIFNGKRQVSLKLAQKLCAKLGLDPQERSQLLAQRESIDPQYLQLSADHFRLVADWQHFAILSLMRCKGFKSAPAWIAKRLGLSLPTTEASIDRMKRLGMLTEDAQGRLTRSKIRYRTSDDVASESVRRAHLQYLENAREALTTLPIEQRDFSAIMLSLSPEQLPRAKEMIRNFQDELSAELEAKPQREVFHLCMQLFPLTKGEKP